MIVIIKNDPLLLKIRKVLKNFKESVMLDAQMKLNMWKAKRNSKFMEETN